MAEAGVEPWVVVLSVVVLVVGVATFRPFVRTLGRAYDRVPSWWAWGDATWHAQQRAVAFAGGGGFAFIAAFLLMLLVSGMGVADSPLFKIAAGAVLFGYPTIWVTIALFNRPRMFVPASMRDKPGLIAEAVTWIRQRRRSSGGDRTEEG